MTRETGRCSRRKELAIWLGSYRHHNFAQPASTAYNGGMPNVV